MRSASPAVLASGQAVKTQSTKIKSHSFKGHPTNGIQGGLSANNQLSRGPVLTNSSIAATNAKLVP